MEGDIGLKLLEFAPWLTHYIPLLAFLAPIIGGGELGVIAAAFLFVKDFTGFSIIVILSALGMIIADSIWFFIARSRFFGKFKNWRRISAQYKNLERNIEKLSHDRDILIISLAKLLAGTRILIVLYISGRKINFKKYIVYNSIVNFLWAIILIFIGLATARGFNSIIAVFRDVQLAITFLIAVFLLFYILQKWISKKLMRRQRV